MKTVSGEPLRVRATEALLREAKAAFYELSTVGVAVRDRALETWANLIESEREFLLAENRKDLEAHRGTLSPSMYKRLGLDASKIRDLVQGIRDVRALPDPVGRVLSRTRLDDGLILDKVSVPIGVVAIVFESRPDVIPQILSLALRSGNAVVLKGGREAFHSNHAFMDLVSRLGSEVPELPKGWAQLVDTREDFGALLGYPDYVDLVIPRGSNEMVRKIMDSTQIPVLGHAEGICHQYVHSGADLGKAVRIAIDSKAQYPAVCNAMETLLVDRAVADRFLPLFAQEARSRGVRLRGCKEAQRILPGLEEAKEDDWSTEYGDLRLAVRVVRDLDEAVSHINRYGSHHTDGIVSEDADAREQFLSRVDSASVISNASTRFADGFRFGLGAEVGISTLKTHARGPVGVEGLTIYKYMLRGSGDIVADYVGENARPFVHERLSPPTRGA
jgi:glutamate-5-semialdehyde dehydrogenase